MMVTIYLLYFYVYDDKVRRVLEKKSRPSAEDKAVSQVVKVMEEINFIF